VQAMALMSAVLQGSRISPWKKPMEHYRAYPLGPNEHFIGATDFEASEDTEALQFATTLCETHSHDVWCGGRFVGKASADRNEIGIVP
jgi:hypothetical protein